jgi:hypothetical protein
LNQEDQFKKAVYNNKRSNARICHMRLYSNGFQAHWHALHAELDDQGDVKKIVITDSRLAKPNEGITAQRDLQSNPFLKEHADKVTFIPGEQQPFKTAICWVYCIANLASLANGNSVYKRTAKGSFTEEISQQLKESLLIQPPHTCEDLIVTESIRFFTPRPSEPSARKIQPPDIWQFVEGIALLVGGIGSIMVGSLSVASVLSFGLAVGIASLLLGMAMTAAGTVLLCTTEMPLEMSAQRTFGV